MEPEHELALKVTAYVELFWYPRKPTAGKDEAGKEKDSLTFAELFPRELLGEGTEQGDVSATELWEKLLHFGPDSHRQLDKSRLRRAARGVGLWTRVRTRKEATKYIAVAGNDEGYRSPSSEFEVVLNALSDEAKAARKKLAAKYPELGDEAPAAADLDDVAFAAAYLLAKDLARLFKIFGGVKNLTFEAEETSEWSLKAREPSQPAGKTTSIEKIEQTLTDKFYDDPNLCALIAVELEYLPSFTETVAQAILSAASAKNGRPFGGRKPIDKILDRSANDRDNDRDKVPQQTEDRLAEEIINLAVPDFKKKAEEQRIPKT